MDIAIVGLSLKLPNDINNLDDLYNKIKNKTDCISEHPVDRFNLGSYYDDSNKIGKINTKKGGYLKNIYDFDNEFFSISTKEAKTMDPQQRILLELVFEAIQDGNISNISNSKTGVFIGSCNTEYFSNQSEDSTFCNEYSITGGLLTLLSNRISYYYNLKGPSLTVDTACSSSGYALHLACKSILSNESDMCIVGGSNLILNPETTVGFSQGQFLSPDGNCKSFDRSANGYVRSEGCVILILKKLEYAIKDNNKIYAVIKNSSINQDGKTDSLTMPNVKQQQKLLKECYKDVDLDELTFIEAHGTGTNLGDKIEATSLGNILGKNRKDKLKIGSIKSIIGHTEATSGLAGICKAILMIKKRKLLPNLHFQNSSEEVDFNELNLEVVTNSEKIYSDKILIGVSNYGFGGANFHCILESYNYEKQFYEYENDNKMHLLCIYGNNEESINKNTYKFLNYENDLFLHYLYNQNLEMKQNEAKFYIIKDKTDFEKNIFNPNKNLDLSHVYGSFSNKRPNIAFIFCGQGPQFFEMGIDLIENFPIFSDKILECDDIWTKISGFSFIKKYKIFTKKELIIDIQIDDPIVAQPALTFFQIALISLYNYFGITPDLVLGHSAGEQVAFYASGAITLYDAIKISYYRSIYQQKTIGFGNMLVINQTLDKINYYIHKYQELELAVINSDESFVLSGPSEQINILKSELKESNILCTIIKGNCPFHSSYQDIIKNDIIKYTKNIKFLNPKIELVSSITGFSFDENDYYQEYWWDNIRNVVRFNDAIDQCSNIDIFIEISPTRVLEQFISSTQPKSLILQSSDKKEDSARVFLSTLAKLSFSGIDIINQFGIENNIYFPKYVWNKKTLMQKPRSTYNRHHGIINKLNTISFEINKFPYIKDHIIGNKLILPTVTYIDLINLYLIENNNCISNFEINEMFNINNSNIEFVISKTNNKSSFISNEVLYCSFNLSKKQTIDSKLNLEYYLKSDNLLTKQELVKILKNKNFNFGNALHQFNNGYIKNNTILLEINQINNFKIDPTIIDVCLTSNMMVQGLSNNIQYLPSKIEHIIFHENKNIPKYVYSEILFENSKVLTCNSYLIDSNFNKVLELNNIISLSIDQNNTKLYLLNYKHVNLPDNLIDYNYKILSNNLLDIRNELFKNNEVIYIIDIIKNYEIVGFIRSLINEIKNVKFKVCYHKNSEIDLINNIQHLDISKIEYFFDSSFKEIELINYIKPNISLKYYNLSLKSKGNLNNLKFKNSNFLDFTDNQVLVKVKSVALNFKDISVIYDLIPENNLGYEFSGVVIESKSESFSKGDEIFGFTENCIANYITCFPEDIFLKPKNLNFTESASIGISFGTAYLSLVAYANLKKEDLVVIHSATGGLGLAAFEICNRIGCKIIATASTQDKRNYLKKLPNLVLITDSRCYETYYNDIMEFTNNDGVDVILSSSINEFMETNLSLLKSGGRYLDVGKRQIYDNHSIPYKYFIKSIQYHAIHFDKLLIENNELVRDIIYDIIYLFNYNYVNKIPIIEYNISEYDKAFDLLSKSQHIGKIVLNIDDTFEPTDCILSDKIFNPEKYYLVTGGMGGLGSKLIDWMKLNGANKFIVTTRSNFKLSDDDIITIQTDLLDCYNLNLQLQNFDIDGVFHLAGTIDDKLANDITEDDISEVMDVKIKGIQNLGTIFDKRNHSFFVAFSSIVSLIGNPGQSLYAGANSFMDEYCRIRQLKGLPALSVNLGAIGGCGMIHENYKLTETMMSNGINFTVYYCLFDKLKLCLLDKNISNICITDQEWNNLKNLNYTQIFDNYIDDKILTDENEVNSEELLVSFICKLLEIDNIDPTQNLISYGVDSIMSMEISNFCRDTLNLQIRQIDILQGNSINEILSKNKVIKKEIKSESNNKFIFKSKNTPIEIKQFINSEKESGSNICLYFTVPFMVSVFAYLYIRST